MDGVDREVPTEIWDVNTGEQLAVLQWGLDITFSGDGKTFAISGDRGYVLWDIPSRRKIAEFPESVKITFSGDGKMLAIIESSGYNNTFANYPGFSFCCV